MMTDKITPEDYPVLGEKFWDKPENVLRLIDLIFFFQEEKDVIPS